MVQSLRGLNVLKAYHYDIKKEINSFLSWIYAAFKPIHFYGSKYEFLKKRYILFSLGI